ncbi:MAG: phosphonate ABC transporter substrate-binding protein [Thermodesulfobacteriota bacterium]|nr:phosphonate ABC transporter substrate-binding protein [Thermodesulfobacteriota bacterium]
MATLGKFAKLLLVTLVFASICVPAAQAKKWQKKYPEITLGVITGENEADRIQRYKPVRSYLEKELGVKVKWRTATDYAGIIEGVKAKKVQLAYFGPASYSKCWIVTKGKVVPLVAELDSRGDFGYHSVVIVKKDSPYKSIDDLKGKKLAFADPNSTSGHQAPRYFLTEAGYNPDKFFGSTGFSGSHENSVMALLNGTFDAAATWWRSKDFSNPKRMEMKKMIPQGQWKVVWKSPKLPNSPWAAPTYLPKQMRIDLQNTLLNMKDKDPAAWDGLTSGKASGFRKVTHADYESIIRMIEANLKSRKNK